MAAKVNYGDNLYYLLSMIRSLRAGLQLEIDGDYFATKIEHDLDFIHRTIEQLSEALLTNTFLINRTDYLRELMRTKRSYGDLLKEITDEELSFARHLTHLRAQLIIRQQEHIGDIADIQSAMKRTSMSDEPENVVGEDEYRFLFQSEEEEET
ncbi:MAG: hypothetical protein ACLFP4_01400 [Spirochaetales bacterium]